MKPKLNRTYNTSVNRQERQGRYGAIEPLRHSENTERRRKIIVPLTAKSKDFGGENGTRAGGVIQAITDIVIKGVGEMFRKGEGLPVHDSGITT